MPNRLPRFVRNSIWLLAAGAVSLLAVVASALWLSINTGGVSTRVAQAAATRQEAYRLISVMQDAETGQRGYLLANAREYLAPYLAARAATPGAMERLEAALAAEGRTAEGGSVRPLVRAKYKELDETIELAATGKTAEAMAIVRTNRGKAVMDELRRVLGAIAATSDRRVTAELDRLQAYARLLSAVSIVGGALVVVFVVIVGWSGFNYTREILRARAEVEALNEELEQRVADRTADLSRANDEIQRFAYIVSHDLRAPLVNVMGFTSELETGLDAVGRYLADDGPAKDERLEAEARKAAFEEMPEAIGFIRSSTGKMDGLINAILKISREGGRLLSPEPIDLKALIERQLGAVRHQLDAAHVRVSVTGEWPSVLTDRLAAEQIFGNLIDNAVKYQKADRPGEVSIACRDLGSRVELAVSDNGRGIAPQDFERIFELFRRSGTQDRPGEGIGLAHVRALVRRLGGEISVDSRLNEGSRFRVVLPKTLSAVASGEAVS